MRIADVNHVVLAVVGIDASVSVVVVEEAVHAGTVDEGVARVHDANTVGTGTSGGGAAGPVRVTILGLGGEGNSGIRVALHVGGLSLEDVGVNVLSIVQGVVVEHAVFRSGTPQPGALGALDQETTAVVDVDLAVIGTIKLVVRHPEPSVLHVDASRSGDVKEQKGAKA